MNQKTLWMAMAAFCLGALAVGFLKSGKHETPADAAKPITSHASAKPQEFGQRQTGDSVASIPESKRHSDDAVEKDRAEKGKLRELEKAVAEQEAKLAAARKELGNVVRNKGIVYQGPAGDYSAKDNPNAKEDAAAYIRNRLAVDREFKTLLGLQTELEKEKARLGIARVQKEPERMAALEAAIKAQRYKVDELGRVMETIERVKRMQLEFPLEQTARTPEVDGNHPKVELSAQTYAEDKAKLAAMEQELESFRTSSGK